MNFPEAWQRFALAFWADFFPRLFWYAAVLVVLIAATPIFALQVYI